MSNLLLLSDRNLGRASSEMRIFCAAPASYPLVQQSDLLCGKETLHFKGSINLRASYLSGQDIFGDAILASIAYTWKSKDLFHEDVTVQSYHRSLYFAYDVCYFLYHGQTYFTF